MYVLLITLCIIQNTIRKTNSNFLKRPYDDFIWLFRPCLSKGFKWSIYDLLCACPNAFNKAMCLSVALRFIS